MLVVGLALGGREGFVRVEVGRSDVDIAIADFGSDKDTVGRPWWLLV